jgi:hypothetical protein
VIIGGAEEELQFEKLKDQIMKEAEAVKKEALEKVTAVVFKWSLVLFVLWFSFSRGGEGEVRTE